MAYIALHYTKINKRLYTPGEIIGEDIPAEQLARLVKLGALKKTGAPAFESRRANETEPVIEPENAPESEPETIPPAAEDTEDEGVEDDIAPPEIDIADGIVKPSEVSDGRQKSKGGKRG